VALWNPLVAFHNYCWSRACCHLHHHYCLCHFHHQYQSAAASSSLFDEDQKATKEKPFIGPIITPPARAAQDSLSYP
jgi:hypothetical protein